MHVVTFSLLFCFWFQTVSLGPIGVESSDTCLRQRRASVYTMMNGAGLCCHASSSSFSFSPAPPLRLRATPHIDVCSYCILTGLLWHQPKILKIDGSVSTQREPAALRAQWSILPRRCFIAAQHGAFLWEFKLFCCGMCATIRLYAAVTLDPGDSEPAAETRGYGGVGN